MSALNNSNQKTTPLSVYPSFKKCSVKCKRTEIIMFSNWEEHERFLHISVMFKNRNYNPFYVIYRMPEVIRIRPHLRT